MATAQGARRSPTRAQACADRRRLVAARRRTRCRTTHRSQRAPGIRPSDVHDPGTARPSSHSRRHADRAAPAIPRRRRRRNRQPRHGYEATYPSSMPEGDALHRAARRLQVLVGQQLEVETPHPRAAVKQLAPRLDGRRLENVEAIGKNLLLRFEGGLVLRSHLRMKGRWRVFRRDTPIFGQPWLILRGDEYVGAMFNGAVLELDRGVARRLGPDILAETPDYEEMLTRFRRADQQRQVGE